MKIAFLLCCLTAIVGCSSLREQVAPHGNHPIESDRSLATTPPDSPLELTLVQPNTSYRSESQFQIGNIPVALVFKNRSSAPIHLQRFSVGNEEDYCYNTQSRTKHECTLRFEIVSISMDAHGMLFGRCSIYDNPQPMGSTYKVPAGETHTVIVDLAESPAAKELNWPGTYRVGVEYSTKGGEWEGALRSNYIIIRVEQSEDP